MAFEDAVQNKELDDVENVPLMDGTLKSHRPAWANAERCFVLSMEEVSEWIKECQGNFIPRVTPAMIA